MQALMARHGVPPTSGGRRIARLVWFVTWLCALPAASSHGQLTEFAHVVAGTPIAEVVVHDAGAPSLAMLTTRRECLRIEHSGEAVQVCVAGGAPQLSRSASHVAWVSVRRLPPGPAELVVQCTDGAEPATYTAPLPEFTRAGSQPIPLVRLGITDDGSAVWYRGRVTGDGWVGVLAVVSGATGQMQVLHTDFARPGPQVAACPGMALAWGECDEGMATLRAFTYDGQPLWEFKHPEWRLGHLSVSDAGDRIAVSVLPRERGSSRVPVETTGAVWVLRTVDGTLTAELTYSMTHCFALRGEALLGVVRRTITLTDLATGRPLWRRELSSQPAESVRHIGAGGALVGYVSDAQVGHADALAVRREATVLDSQGEVLWTTVMGEPGRGQRGPGGIAISPRGTRVALWEDRELWIYAVDGPPGDAGPLSGPGPRGFRGPPGPPGPAPPVPLTP